MRQRNPPEKATPVLAIPALSQSNIHNSVLDKWDRLTPHSVADTRPTVKATTEKQPVKRQKNTNQTKRKRDADSRRRYFLEIGKLISLELTLGKHGVELNPNTVERLGGVS